MNNTKWEKEFYDKFGTFEVPALLEYKVMYLESFP